MNELTKEELLRLSAFSDQLCTAVKMEIQVRKKMVDLLRDTLTEQVTQILLHLYLSIHTQRHRYGVGGRLEEQ